MSGFVEKLNIQNFVNSARNCVRYMYAISGVAEELIIQNCVYVMANCVCYMYEMS